jgi:hypothetical protein
MKLLAVARSGLIAASTAKGGLFWSLNSLHPAHDELLAALRALSQDDETFASLPETEASSGVPLNAERPLAHRYAASFQMLAALATHATLALSELQNFIKEKRTAGVEGALEELSAGDVITTHDGVVCFAPGVPQEYVQLVLAVNTNVEGPAARIAPATRRATSFEHASDGAPRLFGTDLLLRNFMALAKLGPLHHVDLAAIVGIHYVRTESSRYAPFGRAGVVRVSNAPNGIAAALEPPSARQRIANVAARARTRVSDNGAGEPSPFTGTP